MRITLMILLLASLASAQQTPKYNMLFIISDDLRVDLGCYNSRLGAKTPNIDALAKTGVLFDRAYCQFPLCNPTRSSLLTGHRPTVTGILGNRGAFRTAHPDWITLPQLFKENGYSTLRAGKIFHGGIDDPKAWTEGYGVSEGPGGAGGKNMEIAPHPVPPQPEDVLPPLPGDIAQRPNSDRIVILDGNGEGNPDFRVATNTMDYLERYKDKPFFIGCGFAKPHSPMAAPQWCFDYYDINKIELPPDFAPWPTVPPGFPKMAIRMLNADLFIGRGASAEEAKEFTLGYLATVSWMDWNVGRVLKKLDELNLRQKTIVVFWGDHGYQLGEKGKWSKAGSLFEMGTRVPTIIAPPGMGGKVSPRVVETLDFYRTLVELCGLPLPEGIEGRSLVPLLKDPEAPWDHPAYSIWSEDGRTVHGVAVRNEKYRYAEFGPNGSGGAMLFDEAADPFEMKNLADDPKYAAVRDEMSALAKKYVANSAAEAR